MMHERKLKILWAIDAFEASPVLDKMTELICKLGQHAVLEIDPVYVVGPSQLGISVDLAAPAGDRYGQIAQTALEKTLEKHKIPGLNRAQVLLHHKASFRGSVELFARFAEKQTYDLIVVGPSGRKGLERLTFGSFAEDLLLQAKVPVLYVNQRMQLSSTERPNVLIVSDLSEPYSPFFERAFRFAHALEADATLLNTIPRPLEQVLQSGVYLVSGGWIPVQVYVDREREKHEASAAPILRRARHSGVNCTLVIDDSSQSVVDSVLKQAKATHADIIAIAAHSGPVATALLGSITRKIVRDATCPVWVYRPDEKK